MPYITVLLYYKYHNHKYYNFDNVPKHKLIALGHLPTVPGGTAVSGSSAGVLPQSSVSPHRQAGTGRDAPGSLGSPGSESSPPG